MPFITQNDQRLFYTFNKSRGSGPTLVLLHGAGGDHNSWSQSWRQSASASAQHTLSDFPVYTLDLPGHGHSDVPGYNSINDYAQVVLGFIKSLNLKNVVIAGHSMGGAIAQTIGVWQPSKLAGLILIGTGASLPVNPIILDGLQTDFPGTVEMIMKYAWHRESDPASKKQATKRMLNTPPEVVLGDFAACNQFDLSSKLEQIQVPTLIIGSTADKMTPLKYSEFLAEKISLARLAAIENTGHYMMVEKTQETTEAVLAFLKENY